MVRTFSAVSGSHPESLSRHTDGLQRRCPDTRWRLFFSITALQPQEWITKIDFKDAYHHILVNIRKNFRFVTAGKTYQFRVLPFGLSTAPREFTKTLAPLVQLLRTRGIRVHAYLDDWIIRADSPDRSVIRTQQTIQLLQILGWTINWKKSILEP